MLANRRTLSRVLILVFLLSTLAAVPLNDTARAQDDRRTIVIGVTDLASALDPAFAFDYNSWETLSHLYTGLTRQIPGTLEVELALASDVTTSDDLLTWTYTLPDNTAFSDGTLITAQTFVASINRVLTLDEDAADAVTPFVASVTAPDDYTLVFRLTRPIPYFNQIVSLPPYFPQHPDLAAAESAQPYSDNVIGNGPYVLARFALNEEIVLRANPEFALGPQPQNDTIILRAFDRPQNLRDALRKHDIDIAWRALLTRDVETLVSEVEGITLVDVPSTRAFYLYMNHALEPYDDPLVRRAITLLLDRERVVTNAFLGYATPLTSMVPDLYPDAYADIWPVGPDFPAAEDTLLTAAYRPRGRSRLNVTVTTSLYAYGNQIATAASEINRGSFFPSDYVDGGAFADMEAGTFFSALERGEGRLMLFAWTPLVPHPAAYLRPLAHSAERIPARGDYARSQIDALLDNADTLTDPAQQGERYQAASALLLDDYDIIPVWQDHIQLVAWNDIIGIQVEPNFFLHYGMLARQ